MSRTLLTEWEKLVLNLPCPYCGAEPWVWCVRTSYSTGEISGYASWLHSGRDWVLRKARQDGWISREHYLAHIIANSTDPNENPKYREQSKRWLERFPEQHNSRTDCSLCGPPPEAA